MEEERVKKEIARMLAFQTLQDEEIDTEDKAWEWVMRHRFMNEWYVKADQILAIKLGNRTLKEWIELYEKGKLRIEADQSLPENPYVASSLIPLSEGHIGYAEAQQDMLKPDSKGNVRVKVLKKE